MRLHIYHWGLEDLSICHTLVMILHILSMRLPNSCMHHEDPIWMLSTLLISIWNQLPVNNCSFLVMATYKWNAIQNENWAGSIMARQSTSGYCTSSAKAKVGAMARGICELLWVKMTLKELGFNIMEPIRLYCNKAAINMVHNHAQHDRSKHVEIDKTLHQREARWWCFMYCICED